ncbi:MAG TPA: DoxX family protein [Candidatus Limnocylindrales bacterium]|nr:DoxX family protein [Candidatus Limnocylindrales bacterium]
MNIERIGSALGRLLISILFILSGLGKLLHFSATAGMMASTGIPLARVALVLTLIIEIGGGLALLLGFQMRYAAVIMALFLVPVTLTFHNFWAYQGAQQQEQMVNFLKNVAIMGGLLLAASAPVRAAASLAGRAE